MNILVTGANGYLGQGIVCELLKSGNEVTAVDVMIDNIPYGANSIKANFFEIENPYKYFNKPDVLLHLAWRDGFVHDSNAHIEDLSKHCKFISEFVNAGVKQVAVMGTMHEIGFFEGSINEDTPCHPMNLYGISKDALRKYTEYICLKKNVIFQWLRGYYIVGNSKFGNSIFSKITAAVEDGKKEFPFTTGQNQYDFLDYEKFVQQVAKTVSQNNVNGIINICSGRPEKLSDRVERFIKENNYGIKLVYGAFPDREYDSKAVWGDSKKIEEIMRNY